MSQNKALDWNGIYSSRWLSVQQGGSAQKMLVECSCGKGEIFMGSQPSGWAGYLAGGPCNPQCSHPVGEVPEAPLFSPGNCTWQTCTDSPKKEKHRL